MTLPSSKTSLKGGVSPAAESAQLEESSPLLPPSLPASAQSSLGSRPGPPQPAFQSLAPPMPSSLQLLCRVVGMIILADGVPYLSCQPATLTLCLVTCASAANSCLPGPVCLSEVRHSLHRHPHQKELALRCPWGSQGHLGVIKPVHVTKKKKKVKDELMAPLCFLWSTSGGNYRCYPEGILQNTAGASGRAQEGVLPEGRGGGAQGRSAVSPSRGNCLAGVLESQDAL